VLMIHVMDVPLAGILDRQLHCFGFTRSKGVK
jgi:hypothetical protein